MASALSKLNHCVVPIDVGEDSVTPSLTALANQLATLQGRQINSSAPMVVLRVENIAEQNKYD